MVVGLSAINEAVIHYIIFIASTILNHTLTDSKKHWLNSFSTNSLFLGALYLLYSDSASDLNVPYFYFV